MVQLSLENLVCFEAAARLLNFRAAAQAVALSPAAFGQRIKQLEDQLGVSLFVRTTRAVQLTTEGLCLLPQARRCLTAAHECVRSVHAGETPPAEITLGTRFELGMSWLVPELPRIDAEHPSLRIHLYFGASRDLIEQLRAYRIDCFISSVRLTDSSLEASTLHEERYVFAGKPELLEKKPFTKVESAAEHRLVDIDSTLPLFRYLADEFGGAHSFPFQSYRWLGIAAAVKAAVLAGEGVGVLPLYMVQEELAQGAIKRIFPRVKIRVDHFRLVFRANDPRKGVFQALAKSLCAAPIR